MKALSIIGILFSLYGTWIGLIVSGIRADQSNYSWNGEAAGIQLIIINVFFLVLSVILSVKSFKKQKA